jgi:hypothetical protein
VVQGIALHVRKLHHVAVYLDSNKLDQGKMVCIVRKCLHSCIDGKTREIKATMQLIHTCDVIQCLPSIQKGLGH